DGVWPPPVATTDQFEKTSIDNLFCGKLSARTGGLIREYQRSVIWVLISAVNSPAGIHADIMPSYAGHQRSFRSHRPLFDVRFKKVGIIANECGRDVVAS